MCLEYSGQLVLKKITYDNDCEGDLGPPLGVLGALRSLVALYRRVREEGLNRVLCGHLHDVGYSHE